MLTAAQIAEHIRRAFADAPYPGDHDLVRSEGDEPAEVEALFRGRDEWTRLEPGFIDRAGAASPSALSFYSPGAFRFYLPAYLVADVAGQLRYTDPLFYLYHGVDDGTRREHLRSAKYAHLTWWDVQQERFAGFAASEAAAIVAYLRWKLDAGRLAEPERRSVTEALRNYWLERAGEASS